MLCIQISSFGGPNVPLSSIDLAPARAEIPLKTILFEKKWALLEKSLVGKESCRKRVLWQSGVGKESCDKVSKCVTLLTKSQSALRFWQSLKVRYGIPYLKHFEPEVCRVLQFGESWLPCTLGWCVQGTIDLKLRTHVTLPATSHPATIRLGPNAESMNMQRVHNSKCGDVGPLYSQKARATAPHDARTTQPSSAHTATTMVAPAAVYANFMPSFLLSLDCNLTKPSSLWEVLDSLSFIELVMIDPYWRTHCFLWGHAKNGPWFWIRAKKTTAKCATTACLREDEILNCDGFGLLQITTRTGAQFLAYVK